MKALLDTCVFFWLIISPKKVSARARAICDKRLDCQPARYVQPDSIQRNAIVLEGGAVKWSSN